MSAAESTELVFPSLNAVRRDAPYTDQLLQLAGDEGQMCRCKMQVDRLYAAGRRQRALARIRQPWLIPLLWRTSWEYHRVMAVFPPRGGWTRWRISPRSFGP